MEKIERVDRKLMYKGAIIDVYQDTVKIPNGNIAKWDFIDHKGAAAVIPVTKEGKILMVRQYRNALERDTLEIPAGGLASRQEPMIVCAARELEEETGYRSEELEFLIRIRTTVAFCNEQIEVFVARNLQKTQQHLDEDEYVDVEEYEPKELLGMIYEGTLQDSKTVAAILAYCQKYCKE